MNKALITSSFCLLHLNVSKCSSLFVKPLCFNIRITLTVNVGYCYLLLLIVTPHYKLAKTIYRCHLTQMCPIIQPIETHPVSPAQFINPRHINRTNQIFLTTAIREATRKKYIKSVIKMLIHIQKAFIHPLSRKTRRFNTQMKDLMKLTLISLVLRLWVRNVELPFFQNLNFTNI